MGQDVLTNKEEQTNEAFMSEKESQQYIVNGKEKIKVDYDGSGIYGLTILSKICYAIGYIGSVIAFFGLFMFLGSERYEAEVGFIIFIISFILTISSLIWLPIIKGFRTIVKNARYQCALLEKDYDFE